ncbi:MAG: CAP domain-containing protein [Pseudomonadota bacterium]
MRAKQLWFIVCVTLASCGGNSDGSNDASVLDAKLPVVDNGTPNADGKILADVVLLDLPFSDGGACSGVSCSGNGKCLLWGSAPVCVCDPGFTPSDNKGLDCVSTNTVCKPGAINYDYDDDGKTDTLFEPTEDECDMFELINFTRATHDDEGTPECHTPLMWNVEWAAHGRNHSKKMHDKGFLFHDDYPSGQNCAYGCGVECEMEMYMTGPGEPHCPEFSHHCNIMFCDFTQVGVGYYGGTWNTQNFL